MNDASKNMASDAWHDPPVHWWVGENISTCQKGQSGQRVLNVFSQSCEQFGDFIETETPPFFFAVHFGSFGLGAHDTMGRLSKIFHECPTRHLAFAVCFEECENLKAVLWYN